MQTTIDAAVRSMATVLEQGGFACTQRHLDAGRRYAILAFAAAGSRRFRLHFLAFQADGSPYPAESAGLPSAEDLERGFQDAITLVDRDGVEACLQLRWM